ncbi:hypothetical protein G7Y79_00002g005500 [Physcia stellaris]|nr:hypothetical protein G7Y79_00002g005500 [Physcia stellaris]
MATSNDQYGPVGPEIGDFEYPSKLGELEMRLIQIEDGPKTETVATRLIHTCMEDDSTSYDALSYVWGSRTDPAIIICNDRPLLITRNLHDALVQLRQDGLRNPIWIDAICINQADADERARQVRLMRQIFSRAEMVHIWLGKESADTLTGVKLLQQTYKAIIELDKTAVGMTAYYELKAMGLPDVFHTDWKAVAEIITCPWFTRVWVIQEMVVARRRTFMCGSLRLSSVVVETVADGIIEFQSLYFSVSNARPDRVSAGFSSFKASVISFIAKQYAEHGPLKFEDLLHLTNDFDATDLRDKIFALLGMTDEISDILIDYNCCPKDVLIEVAKMFLTQGPLMMRPPLHLLCFAENEPRLPGLPSWVPKWDHRRSLPLHLILQPKNWIDVGEAQYSLEKEDLIIRGKIVDKIHTVVEAAPYNHSVTPMNEEGPLPVFEELLEWNEEVSCLVSNLGTYPTGMPLEEAQWRTLFFNVGMDDEPASPGFGHSYEAWKHNIANLITMRADGSILHIPEFKESALKCIDDCAPFEQAIGRYPLGRRFCVTEKGYIGWVSTTAQAGDEVVAFHGARLLFTVRSRDRGHELRGDCFLQGLMEGEALQLPDTRDEDIILI